MLHLRASERPDRYSSTSPEGKSATTNSPTRSTHPHHPHFDSRDHLNSPSRSETSSPDRWLSIYDALLRDPELREVALANNHLLLITLKQFRCLKGLPSKFRDLVEAFGTQDCLKALSRLFDLTEVRRNKYKFMFERLTLGHSMRLLIKEALLFHQNIVKKRKIVRFEEVMGHWVDALIMIQKVDLLASSALKSAIMETIRLVIACRPAIRHGYLP